MNTVRRFPVLLACAMLAVMLVASSQALAEFTNPVVPLGGDPWAFQWEGQYFYTASYGSNLAVGRSPWLPSLNSNSRVVWDPPATGPYSGSIWAPELHRINNKWYVYLAADDAEHTDNGHRMYVLEGDSQDPQGSYTFKGQISIPSDLYAIDGTVLSYGGQDYMIWAGKTPPVGPDGVESHEESLFIAQMTNPWTLTGTRVDISDPTNWWESHGSNGHSRGVNEGPEILRHGDDIFLTYSANTVSTPYYAIGALKLTGTNPLDPDSWTKLDGLLFQQGNGVEGPGHASFVKSPDGTQDWIVYHARPEGATWRRVYIQPFTWNDDGTPNFGPPITTPQADPSGVPVVTFVPNLSFERGGQGWLDDFHVTGDVGATANDGSQFSHIDHGDGPAIGYLGADGHSALWQDIGPITQEAYTLTVGMAISDDQAQAASDNPAQFILKLISVGLNPGGSANEADQIVLAQKIIDSSELAVSDFQYFDVTASGIDPTLLGDWLRVELIAAGDSVDVSPWRVKLDMMTLSLPELGQASVPEPTTLAMMGGVWAVGLLRRRRAGG